MFGPVGESLLLGQLRRPADGVPHGLRGDAVGEGLLGGALPEPVQHEVGGEARPQGAEDFAHRCEEF